MTKVYENIIDTNTDEFRRSFNLGEGIANKRYKMQSQDGRTRG